VEANRANLKKLQTNVKNVVVQNLISIVERIDTDGDAMIESHEVEEALDQLKKLEGVKVDAKKFRKVFSGMAVKSLSNIIGNINRADVPPEERIFEFPEQS
jgi:phosphomevalonate kinase